MISSTKGCKIVLKHSEDVYTLLSNYCWLYIEPIYSVEIVSVAFLIGILSQFRDNSTYAPYPLRKETG